jgi:O-antigen/teichoic acid export membrane protein
MAYLFQGWYVNFSAGVFIGEKTKELAKITFIGASITIALNLLLVPMFGMMGSAIATLSSYLSMALILLYYSKKSLNVPYSWIKNLSAVGIAALLIYAQPSALNLGVPEFLVSIVFILFGTSVAWLLVMGKVRWK